MVELGTRTLQGANLPGARLDAQVLLGHVLGVERATLYAYPEREVSVEQEQRYLALIERRMRHEPVAYLVEHKEFYGLDFFVDRRVLIPRPETELLVETALASISAVIAAGHTPVIADIGTGSGAIPIALVVTETRLPYIYASDISSAALEVARLNCQRHHVAERVRLLQGDLLAPLPEPVDLLLANLPYVGTDEIHSMTPDVLEYEPHLALFSGPQGLALIERMCVEAKQSAILKPGSTMLLETGYQHREALTQIIQKHWPQASITWKQDYAGFDRLLQVII